MSISLGARKTVLNRRNIKDTKNSTSGVSSRARLSTRVHDRQSISTSNEKGNLYWKIKRIESLEKREPRNGVERSAFRSSWI
jgi:hypothetical protein